MTNTPAPGPADTNPTENDNHLSKYLVTTRIEALYVQQEPNPKMKLYVMYMTTMLGTCDVSNNPSAHVSDPKNATRRNPNRSMSFPATGPNIPEAATANDPISAEDKRKTRKHPLAVLYTYVLSL